MGRLVDDADSVLVVVDAQPGFLRKLEPSRAQAVEHRIRWLVRLAGALSVPVVVTEEEPEQHGATASSILEVLSADHPRHRKDTFGLAACPPIVADLARHGRGTAVLCGLETDVCVAQSALGLLDAGWRVIVVGDAVASPGSAHEQGLARIRDAGAEVVGTKGLAYEWLRTVERSGLLDAALADDVPTGIVL